MIRITCSRNITVTAFALACLAVSGARVDAAQSEGASREERTAQTGSQPASREEPSAQTGSQPASREEPSAQPASQPASQQERPAPKDAAAQPTNAADLLARVSAALYPSQSRMREIEIVTRNPEGKEKIWRGREARRTVGGEPARVMLLDEPLSVRGFAVLAIGGSDTKHDMWVYTPPLERVRKLEYTGMAQSFLGTDLTYADLGLFDFSQGDSRLAGEDTIDGKPVKVIETVPSDQRAYSRVLTYVTADGFPVRREYRDVAGRPWRIVEYEATQAPGGSPVLSSLEARDVQTGYVTELRYAGVASDAEMPEELFDPAALARIAEERRLYSLSDEGGQEANGARER